MESKKVQVSFLTPDGKLESSSWTYEAPSWVKVGTVGMAHMEYRGSGIARVVSLSSTYDGFCKSFTPYRRLSYRV